MPTERDKISPERLETALNEFRFEGVFSAYAPHGCGHINDTFLLTFNGGKKYILQRINGAVFKDIPKLMGNFELITEFLAERAATAGIDPERGVLRLIYTKTKKSYICADGEYFRAFAFIDGATSFQRAESPELLREAGRAFGGFARLLDGFDAAKLYESIPRFHDTESRCGDFLRALKADRLNRAKTAEREIEFTLARRGITDKITRPLRERKIPLRVAHNDTKINNVMIDDETGKAAAVIDLDTVMPGSLLYDFGDSVRSGCNTGGEDERDLNLVNFDFTLFRAYSEGYIGEVGRLMTDAERELTAFAPPLMTFECGMRFLTDYLDGDVYFKTEYAEHNLARARAQYKLTADMEKNGDKMRKVLEDVFRRLKRRSGERV
ncbi:MAG: aminoglycoside phosphotransferase family protein [Clostridiales bacterium]|jgi:hypothetical protein|nr:aminoglycoside phosphotransferase family protein [Clostridiales bacterium]